MSLVKHKNRKICNFSAGPSSLPYEVLEIAQKELIDFNNLGLSVMEISHRSATFNKIITKAENSVRELLKVPENYKILFLQGGGNGQFSAVPMNLINRNPSKSADYFVTGYWSGRAAEEASKYGTVNLVLPATKSYTTIPPAAEWKLNKDASYIYICDNETIDGVEFNVPVECEGIPLVADCSSNLFSKPIDISKYGVVFAGAQKNFGPAGTTVVIVREDLLGLAIKECPTILDYKIQAGNNSLYQTPPCYGIYICGLVFDWLKNAGGMETVGQINAQKANLLYETIDNSGGFYISPVDKKCRSRMTIPFRIYRDNKPEDKLEKQFIEEGEREHKLFELKGHRSVGGIRAAIFNAVSLQCVQQLVDFMKLFQAKHQTH
jgi:phosphoserine aminotransferase